MQRRRTPHPEVLTEDEIRRLLRACSAKAPTGVRNRALIVALYRGGLRLGEALALKAMDLDLIGGTVRVITGNGDRARVVGIDPDALALIQLWLDVRGDLGHDGHQPLFCTLRGAPLKDGYVRALLPRLARKAGIEKRVHAQALRHTHALELVQEGQPLPVIQAQLGHANLATTCRYVRDLASAHVIDVMRSRSWSP